MKIALGTLALLVAAASAARAGDMLPTNPRYGPLRVASHKVEVTVDNQMAMTRVEQVFANEHGVQLEAHYVFPVPKGATIIDFSMTVNGKLMRGELLEKQRARSIYEGIVRQSKDPGLLEHVGANIFRVRVFPVLPASQQKVELTYLERVNYDGGQCRYVYPLAVPGSAGNTKTDSFDFRWRLASAVPVKDARCSTHPANIVRRTESAAEIAWSAAQADLSKDLEILYRLERPLSGMDLVAHRPSGAPEGTFVLLVTPEADPKPVPKDMTFVFDTSGSMEGDRIRQARAALRFCLSKLSPDDRFNIFSFSDWVKPFSEAHVAASDENKAKALRFVDALDASGSTDINGALLKALQHRPDPSRPHYVLFLTDGEPTSGETRPDAIVRNALSAGAANVRLFTFGVGNQLNKGLLEDLADGTRAVSEWVDEKENIEDKVSRLQKKIARPVLTNLSIEWGDAEVSAVYPRALGDLFAGAQLMVTGRYRKAGTFEATLKGQAGGQPVEIKQKLVFPERRDDSQAAPYLWAMRKVSELLDSIRRQGESQELVTQVINLSRQYRIATPYTSFLVLETEAAYDQYGLERKGNQYKPPAPVAAAPPQRPPTHVLQPEPGRDKKLLDQNKSVEDPVYRKEAAESDHNEMADEEEFQKEKGDSLDKPFRGKGTYDSFGGGGGGGRYGSRLGGKRHLVARGGGSAETEDAVLGALKWLAKNQKPDGSWDPAQEDFRVGTTGLALLAFLGSGYSHLSKDVHDGIAFGDAVRKGLQFLMSKQDLEGCVGARDAAKYMYSHVIAALALSEAFGITGSNLLRDQAQKAIDFIAAAQNPGKGWRYSFRCGDSDTSVTAWALLALKSAELSGLGFPRAGYDGARSWLAEVTDENGRVGYTHRGTGKVFIPGKNETFDHHETLTAMGMLSTTLVDKNRAGARGADLLVQDPPEWKDGKIDFYYWFFGTQALYQLDGPAGPRWKAWNAKLVDALLKNRDADGSWPGIDRWGGS